ncbi:hypothetical protein A5821_002149 [Enterococcus sp. 7F3_DIV0205]|uniref:Gram-positive cocci surface proteins LPxTG domain-containing protein n=1 Tax=Candidatus Enterococcus palustris TaxID=1834189 RepID=A0AAQ3W9F0_9ENTE|nr:hypothetical protein [Enterococcus sp. 7F3_DIV0205]OTN82588.1 hypothetical protein A5821_002499 [Enterococcus sp. 7F3_DIV0205]
MKKNIIVLFFLICLSSLSFGEPAEAASHKGKTNVEITFQSEQASVLQPPSKENLESLKKVGKLPSTGELIASIIWLLSGASVLIFLVGMISLRTVMSKNVWERLC